MENLFVDKFYEYPKICCFMNGIITLSLVPLRAKDNECSEMTSQLLFGETVEILESKERWLYVRNHSDNYCGWVDKKMISLLPENGEKNHNDIENFRILKPVSFCRNLTKGNTFPLPGGSILRNYQNGNFTDGTYQYAIHPSDAGMPQPLTGNNIVSLARQYLSSPYLWGGKSALGIDCSGLVQVVFSLCGIMLPRNASQQAEIGEEINSLALAHTGDLAFFANAENHIIHVGILMNAHQIIHASGWVKIEKIDEHGIISEQTGNYSHKLHSIKRMI